MGSGVGSPQPWRTSDSPRGFLQNTHLFKTPVGFQCRIFFLKLPIRDRAWQGLGAYSGLPWVTSETLGPAAASTGECITRGEFSAGHHSGRGFLFVSVSLVVAKCSILISVSLCQFALAQTSTCPAKFRVSGRTEWAGGPRAKATACCR